MRKTLKSTDFISPATGSSITFHMIRWDNEMDSLTLKAGGNILFHKLADDTVMHDHDFGEICLVLKGMIRHHVNGQTQDLTGGTLVFIRPGDVHCFQQYENEICELVNFAYGMRMLDDLSQYLGSRVLLKRLSSPAMPPTYNISVSEADELSVQLLTINTLQITAIDIAAIRVRKILADLFVTYFLEKEAPYVNTPSIPTWLERVCNAMKNDDNLRVGLKAMQAMAGCTPEHLCASFRKYINKTPTEFINELRVNKAARKLVESDEKILSIAYDLGFRSQSRFYQIFKKHYNLSPARYRALSRQNDIPVGPAVQQVPQVNG